ncbi:MAG: NAD(P)/FAD-dependent oxidoreductase [Motiliproteus sp.]|nr:NAD(P)/FAD-dependent oxidoreductase [Motiliproteus sp.]MCW9052539.1 NAD(P)/FAD-dependent oxidoreductase [Motiliproteus sp.]
MQEIDVVIVGAGAAGLMCAAQAGYRGRKVVVLDHAKKAGKKILMSGGGRCNFTNRTVSKDHYVCSNPHFIISALKRFDQNDFIEQVERHAIPFHEREWGQLFCNDSSKAIVEMLLTECEWAQAKVHTGTSIKSVKKLEDGRFQVVTSGDGYVCQSVVIASGGLSFANAGATGFGYDIARQFGLNLIATDAALVPFTLKPKDLERFKPLSGIAIEARIHCNGRAFRENVLFTHRGFSGPAVLQVSNYWKPGQSIEIDLFPHIDLNEWLQEQRQNRPRAELRNILGETLTKRLAQTLCQWWQCDQPIGQFSESELKAVATKFQRWLLVPAGTEGYRTAEVTRGGVDTNELSSKTMESKKVPGLYFVGEVMDVTGWLGGYNFQWAWASGFAAGQFV